MTKSQCYLNLGLIILVGVIITIIYNHISPEPDYMKSSFPFILPELFVYISPALIVLLIGLIVQWFRKPGRKTTNPKIGSAFLTGTYGLDEREFTPQTEEDKKKMEEWEKKNFLGKIDTDVKAGWKTIFIIAWIVFLLINIMGIYGNWMLMNSN